MSKILVVSEDAGIVERLNSDSQPLLEVTQTAWGAWNIDALPQQGIDLVLLDLRNPHDVSGAARNHLVVECKKLSAETPVLFVTDVDPVVRQVMHAAAQGRNMAFADPDTLIDADDMEHVVVKFLNRHKPGKAEPVLQAKPQSRAAFPHLVPQLRNSESGRLDARRISNLFGIPLKQLSNSIAAVSANVYKTPDAPSLQDKFSLYERIARTLFLLVGSEEGIRIWLNTPEPELDGELPRDLLLSGEVEVVADLLEDMLEGQPG